MANAYAGEVALVLDGQRHLCKLTLGSLAELEQEMEADSLFALIERFETGRYRAQDVLSVIVAGLRGGGWEGTKSDLLAREIEGGLPEAARVAARLLVLAFAPFGS